MIHNFSLETAPLRANLSIDASAGTGKTHTLEHIVCRLIEHYNLNIKQILLVTYTDKAAEELRIRIRSRLSLRLEELRQEIVVEKLQAQIIPIQHNITKALNQFNEANVSTIHSFFRRCLEQFALETGQILNNVGSSASPIDPHARPIRQWLLETLNDNFDAETQRDLRLAGPILSFSEQGSRRHFRLKKLLEFCESSSLDNFWLQHPNFQLVPGAAELKKLEALREQLAQSRGPAYEAFCQLAQAPWPIDAFSTQSSSKKLKNLPVSYKPSTAATFFQQLHSLWQDLPAIPGPKRLDRILELLCTTPQHPQNSEKLLAPYIDLLGLQHPELLKQNNQKFLEKHGSLAKWPYFERTEKVQQFFANFAPCLSPHAKPETGYLQSLFAARFLLRLRREIAPKLQVSQLLYGTRSFTDMIEGLYRVLVLKDYGDTQGLTALLRSQYRCVLIDEFQDTDPIQWQILQSIFGEGEAQQYGGELQRSHNYIIVGDPKQSIYSFRGACSQLYRQVRQGCDRRYRLGENYRSNSLTIGACNQIFTTMWPRHFEAARCGRQGKQNQTLLLPPEKANYSGLSFLNCDPVANAPKKFDKAGKSGQSAKSGLKELQENCHQAIERQVVRLLSQDYRIIELPAAANPTTQKWTQKELITYSALGRPVRPGDIAILMQNNSDCLKLYQRLQSHGIPVHYSEKRSVFQDPHARALYHFLQALCQPREWQHSLRLLLSPLFALTVPEAHLLLGLSEQTASAGVETTSQTPPSDFGLGFMQQLSLWKEQVDQGQLLEVLAELFNYGIQFHNKLQTLSHHEQPSELPRDVYSRLLGAAQYLASDNAMQNKELSAATKISASPNTLRAPELRELQRQNNCQSYSNLRQLTEILGDQQLQRGLDCRELCRYLGQQLRQIEKSADGAELDAPPTLATEHRQQNCNEGQAVQIMTVHSSKGLEFPIVLLGIGLSEKRQKPSIVLHSELSPEYRQFAYLQPSAEILAQRRNEEHAERQRLFYVGLTRASCKIYLPLFPSHAESPPFLNLLRESLQGDLQDPQPSGELRKAANELAREFPRLFSLEETTPISPHESLQLQSQLSQHGLQSRSNPVSPELNIVPAPTLQSLKINHPLGFPSHQEGTPPEQREFVAGVAPELIGYRKLKQDNLAQRFPAVSSFSSLQRGLSQDPSQNANRNRASNKPDNLPSNLALAPETIDNMETAYLSAGDNLGYSQDRERGDGGKPPDHPTHAAEYLEIQGSSDIQGGEFKKYKDELQWHELLLSPSAELGNLLHDLLERADYAHISQLSCAELQQDESFYEQLNLLSRRYFPRNWIKQARPALCRMVWHTLHSNLNIALAAGEHNTRSELRLCQLSPEQRRHELEFLLAIPRDCQIDKKLLLQAPGDKIQIGQGFLKGFIDLLFVNRGQLYLLDWKSNIYPFDDIMPLEGDKHNEGLQALQRQLYRKEALEQLMSSHNYQMQYLIYLAVVYYYLKRQYGEQFNYKKDFGGCYYLFLRGMSGGDSGIYYHKPAEILLQQILKALGLNLNSDA